MLKKYFCNLFPDRINFFHDTSIPIVYACNDKHAILALVSMTSIMENTKLNVEFIILYSNLSQHSIDMLKSILKYPNAKLLLKKVDEKPFKDFKNVYWVTIETWFRVLVSDLFPNYDKIIYLDCDTLCNSDISVLYNIDISDKLVAAVKDLWGIKQACKRTGLCDNSYFNAGVLLINSKKWRKENVFKKIMDYANKNKECAYADQDVLNCVISEDKKLLPMKFNFMEGWWNNYKNEYEGDEVQDYEYAKINPSIIHFTAYKPNEPNSHHSMKELWWKYAKKTIWYSVEEEKKCLKEIYEIPSLNYDGTIPICYIVNEKDAQYALVSLISILENTKNYIDVIIIDLGLKDRTKKIFGSLNYQNYNIKYIKIDKEEISAGFPALNYFVFKISDFISDYNKIIYLGNTTLLNGDIQEFYNYDISNFLVGAVQDVWHRASSNKIKLTDDNYFSCGVMLLNVENLQKANLLEKAFEYHKSNAKLSEQDILNKIINNDKILLSPKYNYMEAWWHNCFNEYKYNALREYEKAKKNPLIINFTGYLPDYVQSKHSYRDLWRSKKQYLNVYIEKFEELKLDNIFTQRVFNNYTERVLNIYVARFDGLGNRIKHIITNMRIHKGKYDTIDVHWSFGDYIYNKFFDLFRFDAFERINEISYSVFLDKSCREGHTWMLGLSRQEIDCVKDSIPSGFIDFEYNNIPRSIIDIYLPYFNALRPSEQVQEIIDSVKLPEKYVSVHIRCSKDWKNAKRWKDDDIYKYIEEMKKYSNDTYFYLVCHTKEIEDVIKKHFNDRIITLPNKDYDLKDNKQHVADLYLLAGSSELLAAYGSTFSEVAWWLGGCTQKVITVGDESSWDLSFKPNDVSYIYSVLSSLRKS